MLSVWELFGQESGVMIDVNGDVIVLTGLNFVNGDLELDDEVVYRYHTDDMRNEIPGSYWIDEYDDCVSNFTVIHDENGDIPALFGVVAPWGRYTQEDVERIVEDLGADVYVLDSGDRLIAPNGWN